MEKDCFRKYILGHKNSFYMNEKIKQRLYESIVSEILVEHVLVKQVCYLICLLDSMQKNPPPYTTF